MTDLVVAITGATASGKSALALDLADACGGEIVSVDSRQVYAGLEVGTAAPSDADRARVPHHLVGSHDPRAPLSAGAYARLVAGCIDDIQSRDAVPVLVGGSMLYLDAVVHGLSPAVDVDLDLDALTAETATPEGREALYDELRRADPAAAATLDATKTQRLARFVGLLRATGRPPSELWAERASPRHKVRPVVLDRPRDELYTRIETRVGRMLADGLVDENRRLLAQGLRLDRTPLRTIGYAEVIAYLEGDIDADEMVRLLKRNTRRYAKRQLTWLRRRPYPRVDAASATPETVWEAVR